MPKSRHRKNQKKKSRARSENVKNKQMAFQKQMKEEFMKKLEEPKTQQTGIEEVPTSMSNPQDGSVSFDEVKP